METYESVLFRLTAPYDSEQLDCICEALYKAQEGAKLLELFRPDVRNAIFYRYHFSSSVIRGYLYALYHSHRFEELFQAISTNRFEEKYFEELQDLWYKAKYAENEQRRHKELGAVEKYRLRKKHPPPRTIWDGEETVYSFKENSRKLLRQFYKRNKYPTLDEKKEISRVTELKIVQISNWFKNRRQRDKGSSDHLCSNNQLKCDNIFVHSTNV
ncbi:hypothetical protein AB6A40_000442 [Gnathostoma spinigerum]|uniref:Homeobox domain-containing protein n=1 Tax=Gnathostoma spinigerum TaxID=75299 RepID=A0ABD6E259_9BILA